MKSSKTTRRALLGSLTSLVLCFAMLIGSTFAWFTDSASTSVNTIKAGTLKVDIVNEQGASIKGQSISFVNNAGSSEILWEPGATFVTTGFQIKNGGNLALKYRLALNGVQGDAALIDAIEFSVGTKNSEGEFTPLTSFEGALNASDNVSDVLYIKGTMKTTAGNDCQGKSITGLAVNVYATQDTVEYDSNSNQYDAGATLAIGVSSMEELQNLLSNNSIVENGSCHIMLLNDIDMTGWATADLRNRNVTIDGNGKTLTNLTTPFMSLYGTTCIINDLTVDGANVTDSTGDCLGSGIILKQAQWANLYMTNCHVKNSTLTVGRDTRSGALVGYWIGGGELKDCSVDNVTITNSAGSVGGLVGHRAIQSGYVADAKLTGCSVTGTKLKTSDNGGWRVGSFIGTVADGTTYVDGYTTAGNTLTQTSPTDPNHELYGRESGGNVVIGTGTTLGAGLTYVANGVAMNAAGEYEISSAAGLNWFNDQINKSHNNFNNKTLKLTADIDYKGATWLPAGQNFATDDPSVAGYTNTVEFHGTFDGNGKTISNIKIAGLSDTQVNGLSTAGSNGGQQQVYSVAFIGYASGATIKNLTIKDVTVTGSHYVAAIVGMTDAGASVENCHVENATITCKHINETQCGDKAGGIVGNLNSSVSGCSVKNSTISAGRDAGQVVGCAQSGSFVAIDCTATNVTVSAGTGCNGANINNAIIGRDLRS